MNFKPNSGCAPVINKNYLLFTNAISEFNNKLNIYFLPVDLNNINNLRHVHATTSGRRNQGKNFV
jgi:hypothetical protein